MQTASCRIPSRLRSFSSDPVNYVALATRASGRRTMLKHRLAVSAYRFDDTDTGHLLIDAFHGEMHFQPDSTAIAALNRAWQQILEGDQSHFIGHDKSQPESLQRLAIDILFERLRVPKAAGLAELPLSINDSIVVPYSSTQLLMAALQCRPKQHLSRALCPAGFYKGSAKLAQAAGLRLDTIPVDLQRDGVMIPERLDNYLAAHHRETALLWLTMPGNPLIASHSLPQLESIARILVCYDVDVLIDMAFDKLLPPGALLPLPNVRVPDATGRHRAIFERTFAVTGNSKGLGASGPWKLGAGVCGHADWRAATLERVTAVTFQRESTHLIQAGIEAVSETYLGANRQALRAIQQDAKRHILTTNRALGSDLVFAYGNPVYTPFLCLGLDTALLRGAGITDSCDLADFLLAGAGIESVPLDVVGIHHPGVRLNVAAPRIGGNKSPRHLDLLFARLQRLLREARRGLTYHDSLDRIGLQHQPQSLGRDHAL
jgi:aspartate/methionine/tyrosine aminotransferase